MKARASLISVIALFLFLAGCARTQVASVWVNRAYSGPALETVVILAQVGDGYNRSAWESIIAERYRRSGMEAVPAITVFPESTPARLDLVIAGAREQRIEGVLMVRHVDTRTEKTYHPPETHYYYTPRYYYPYRGYRGYYPYYRYYPWYYYGPYPYYYEEYVVTPGYTSYHRVVRVESYLYNSGTGEQVLSMTTETTDPKSPNHLAADISRSTFRILREHGLIRLTR